ncbi:type II toxin-antitoxin system VapC family toxin [Serinicoccus sp. CNJ-927]|uniref:type II toxin-antitoxin system VapC family toxin n=1 Tax=Serinicoccus sp. CNJ-927 TaxID=1904970 RepID=UPI00192CFA74|nr:type II toxin-antitoxin system VapC family toxin [Serinicoccus sp. CNJ-927]
MAPMQRRVLELRHNATAYDAFYVALAETLGIPLLTDDQQFARAPGMGWTW